MWSFWPTTAAMPWWVSSAVECVCGARVFWCIVVHRSVRSTEGCWGSFSGPCWGPVPMFGLRGQIWETGMRWPAGEAELLGGVKPDFIWQAGLQWWVSGLYNFIFKSAESYLLCPPGCVTREGEEWFVCLSVCPLLSDTAALSHCFKETSSRSFNIESNCQEAEWKKHIYSKQHIVKQEQDVTLN